MSRVTLKDVAAQAGVSYQTVSKVLNGQGAVTPETQARIEQAAATLNYRPNVSARNLRNQSSNLIGYAWRKSVDNTPHPVLDQFLYSAVQVVESHQYHLLTFLIGADEAMDVSVYEELFARQQVEGFILADTNRDDARIAYLKERGIPFVSFGRANDAWDFCWVDVDGRFGIYIVMEHLLQQGHRRIALLSWPEGSQTGDDRVAGYQDGLQTGELPFDPTLLIRSDNSVRAGVEGMNQLLALAERPTAVVCVSDQIAIGAINAAAAAGLTVGSDIAITGYDDIPMAQFLHPPLTTVRQPIAAVGTEVINMLFNQLQGKPIAQKGVLLRPELIVRASA